MTTSIQACVVELPRGFRVGDVLKFHQRDALAFSERVEAGVLHKGLIWAGCAASLMVDFQADRANVEISLDDAEKIPDATLLSRCVSRMLGLTQPVEKFEAQFRGHPQLGPLIERQSGLRVPLAATPFEALTWAITGQQISVNAAVALRRKLIKAGGLMHSGGLACYPDARQLSALDESELRAAGFSASKAKTLLAVSAAVTAGELPLDDWLENPPVELLRERLLAIRGIGPWTVNYTLLRGFGWLDGSLHGDVAVRRALQLLPDIPEKVSEAEAKAWLEPFSPWRALVGAHLWASLVLTT